jgi:hypothetical protein
MHFQTGSQADRFSLMGQVLSADDKTPEMNEMPVHLRGGTSELASTSTNQLGELYIEHESVTDLQVSLEISAEEEVFIPLDEAIWRVGFCRKS